MTFSRMHDVLSRHVSDGVLPGLVTLVSVGGEVRVDTIGTQAAGGSEPMRRDTIFRIASMTKPVTAVAAMILVEECLLRLDDPIDEFLPELADRQVRVVSAGTAARAHPGGRTRCRTLWASC